MSAPARKSRPLSRAAKPRTPLPTTSLAGQWVGPLAARRTAPEIVLAQIEIAHQSRASFPPLRFMRLVDTRPGDGVNDAPSTSPQGQAFSRGGAPGLTGVVTRAGIRAFPLRATLSQDVILSASLRSRVNSAKDPVIFFAWAF